MEWGMRNREKRRINGNPDMRARELTYALCVSPLLPVRLCILHLPCSTYFIVTNFSNIIFQYGIVAIQTHHTIRNHVTPMMSIFELFGCILCRVYARCIRPKMCIRISQSFFSCRRLFDLTTTRTGRRETHRLRWQPLFSAFTHCHLFTFYSMMHDSSEFRFALNVKVNVEFWGEITKLWQYSISYCEWSEMKQFTLPRRLTAVSSEQTAWRMDHETGKYPSIQSERKQRLLIPYLKTFVQFLLLGTMEKEGAKVWLFNIFRYFSSIQFISQDSWVYILNNTRTIRDASIRHCFNPIMANICADLILHKTKSVCIFNNHTTNVSIVLVSFVIYCGDIMDNRRMLCILLYKVASDDFNRFFYFLASSTHL